MELPGVLTVLRTLAGLEVSQTTRCGDYQTIGQAVIERDPVTSSVASNLNVTEVVSPTTTEATPKDFLIVGGLCATPGLPRRPAPRVIAAPHKGRAVERRIVHSKRRSTSWNTANTLHCGLPDSPSERRRRPTINLASTARTTFSADRQWPRRSKRALPNAFRVTASVSGRRRHCAIEGCANSTDVTLPIAALTCRRRIRTQTAESRSLNRLLPV